MAGELPFGWAPSGELTAYTPTLRERVSDWLRPMLFTDDRAGQEKANRLTNWAETMIPPFGFATQMYDTGRAGGEGDYLTAGTLGAMAFVPGGSKKGIRAYHGSPHSFDKFSMEKLGTGEGAQAYGDGLYFTENENIAKGYRDALTDPEQVKIRINDKHIPSVWVDDLRNTFPEMYKGLRPDDQDIMDSLLGTMESAYSIEDAARAAESVGGRAKTLFNQRVKPFVTKPEVGPGSMYEVDINADPEKFLDWHKPLNEQTQYVKDALGGGIDLNNWGHKTGEDLVKYGLANGHRQFLMEREVPGIKYLANDGSRSAGEGARNYVVFDDNLISIVRKYGIAGASAMLGYNLLESVNPAQADELKRIEAGK